MGNQFANFIGKGKKKENEPDMAGRFADLSQSKKGFHGSGSGKSFFSKENSQQFQDVQDTLFAVTKATNVPFTENVAENEKMVAGVMGQYMKLISACNVYMKKKGGMSIAGRSRKNRVAQIQKNAERDLNGIQQVYYAMKGMAGAEQRSLNWDEIINSARADELEMEGLTKGDSGATKTAYMTNDGVFFPETKALIKNSLQLNSFSSSMHNMDEEMRNKEINATNRNVATSNVANLIGAGHLIEQSRSVNIKEKTEAGEKTHKGIIMTQARGNQFSKEKISFYDRQNEAGQKMRDIATMQGREELAKKVTDVNMQKELSTIQVVDYICGQGDRHTANYFVESKNGKYTSVHGIDNDMAFSNGVDLETTMKNNKGSFQGDNILKTRMVVDSQDNLVIPHMDYQLAMNIRDIKEEELRSVLKGLIEPEFVEAAVLRLKKVQRGIEKEMSKKDSDVFVKDGGWNEKTHNDFMNAGRMKKLVQLKKKEAAEKGQTLSDEAVLSKIGSGSMLELSPEERYQMAYQDNMYSDYISNLMGLDTIRMMWMDNMFKTLG